MRRIQHKTISTKAFKREVDPFLLFELWRKCLFFSSTVRILSCIKENIVVSAVSVSLLHYFELPTSLKRCGTCDSAINLPDSINREVFLFVHLPCNNLFLSKWVQRTHSFTTWNSLKSVRELISMWCYHIPGTTEADTFTL